MQVEDPVLRIMERTNDGVVVVVVQGEIDIATVGALRARLADACQGDATVDLRRVEFIDCMGLALLLEQHAHSTAHGWRLDFVQGPPAVRRVFELTGTLERLSFIEPAARRFAAV